MRCFRRANSRLCFFTSHCEYLWPVADERVRVWLSTFPSGWSAVALLLLRAIVGVSALGQGYLCLVHLCNWASLAKAVVLLPFGLCVLAGFITPISSLLVALGILAGSTSWFASPATKSLDCNAASFEAVVISLALAMMGPGSFSIDARLFGRREILIPPRSRPK